MTSVKITQKKTETVILSCSKHGIKIQIVDYKLFRKHPVIKKHNFARRFSFKNKINIVYS